jgi:malonyl CoA-acyl carrier protein transacylase
MFDAGQARARRHGGVLGLDDAAAEASAARPPPRGAWWSPANFNSPGQIVISGDVDAVEREELLRRSRPGPSG